GGNRDFVLSDIRAVAEAAHAKNALLKVIIETILLSEDEKRVACELSERAGAEFVKTSTGSRGGGATGGDVALMRRTVKIGVEASGGIRRAADATAILDDPDARFGESGGVHIIREMR